MANRVQTGIKLLRCILTHPFPVGPTRRTTWTCQQAFVGDDYPGDIPQRIKSAEISLEFMNEWLPRQLGDGDEFTGSAHQIFAANKWAQIPTQWSHGTLSLGEQTEAHLATTETQNLVFAESTWPLSTF